MIRLLVLIGLLCSSVVYAQSDTRKVAVFRYGGNGSSTSQDTPTTGYGGVDTAFEGISQADFVITTLLEQMGVPYTFFSFQDSANWGTSSATPTKADSTWFREQGYLGAIFVGYRFGTSVGHQEPYKFFTDAAGNRGVQQGSIIDGKWGIPVIGIAIERFVRVNGAEVGIFNYIASGAGQEVYTAVFEGTVDSLEFFTRLHTVDPSQNVTPIIAAGDSLDDNPAAGSFVKAWQFEDNLYYYTVGDNNIDGPMQNPIPIILGLNKMFTVADYRPRTKLKLHLTIDHTVPKGRSGAAVAGVDSMYSYFDLINAKHVAGILTGSTERKYRQTAPADSTTAAASDWYTNHRESVYAYHPHAHQAGYGDFFDGSVWDVESMTDTATQRAAFNWQLSTIEDTLKLSLAKGFEKQYMSPGGPGSGMNPQHIYILIENGYKYLRATNAADGDSLGHRTLHNKIAHYGRTSGSTGNAKQNQLRPKVVGAGGAGVGRKTGTITVITPVTSPGSSDTTWTDVHASKADFAAAGNFRYSAYSRFVRLMGQAVTWQMDLYWHEINSEGPDAIPASFMRRVVSFMNHADRVVEISPYFNTRTPNRRDETR